MRRVSANKNVLSSRLNSVRQNCCRSSAAHSRGPATPNFYRRAEQQDYKWFPISSYLKKCWSLCRHNMPRPTRVVSQRVITQAQATQRRVEIRSQSFTNCTHMPFNEYRYSFRPTLLSLLLVSRPTIHFGAALIIIAKNFTTSICCTLYKSNVVQQIRNILTLNLQRPHKNYLATFATMMLFESYFWLNLDLFLPRSRLKFGERAFSIAAPKPGTLFHSTFVKSATPKPSNVDWKHFYFVNHITYHCLSPLLSWQTDVLLDFIYCMCVLPCILSYNCHRLISVSCKPALSAILVLLLTD